MKHETHEGGDASCIFLFGGKSRLTFRKIDSRLKTVRVRFAGNFPTARRKLRTLVAPGYNRFNNRYQIELGVCKLVENVGAYFMKERRARKSAAACACTHGFMVQSKSSKRAARVFISRWCNRRHKFRRQHRIRRRFDVAPATSVFIGVMPFALY